MLKVERIWWREVTPGDYFNIEKSLGPGPKGQLHVDVPNVPSLLTFLGLDPLLPKSSWLEVAIAAGVVGDPSDGAARLRFRPRASNDRFDIPLQNRHHPDSERHPAWTPAHSWPLRAGGVANTEQAKEVTGLGLHLYVVRVQSGSYFAGFTTGNSLPAGWPDQTRPLFEGRTAGVIEATTGTDADALTPLATDILAALARRKNVLVYGPPGTGKTFAVSQVWRLAQSVAGIPQLVLDPADAKSPFAIDPGPFPLPSPVVTDWVTFHQDYGYEDFIVGLRPAADGLSLVPHAGRLLDAAIRLWAAQQGSALLLVDEINRGNVPKILGDFITFMDEDYRVAADGSDDRSIPVSLPKVRLEDGGAKTEPIALLRGGDVTLPAPWYFPRDVYVLATMNSVDRAVAPLDTAIGRRFERIDALPDVAALAAHLDVDLAALQAVRSILGSDQSAAEATPEDEAVVAEAEVSGGMSGAADGVADVEEERVLTAREAACLLLVRLNDEIAERLGPDFELGHLYFWNVDDWPDLQRVWDNDIWPQLRDRFGSRPDQLAEILKVDQPGQPANMPFCRRSPQGTSLSVARLSALPVEQAAAALRFLCTA